MRTATLVIFGVIGAALLYSQPASSDVPANVNMDGLTAVQKTSVIKVLKARDCSCTCGMKVSECRVKDPNCAYSKGLAVAVVDAIKSGKTEDEALTAADASQWAQLAERETRILSDPVKIPTDGSPVIGPPDARIKLVEFSDFQCPFCILATPQIEALLKAYPDQVSLTFKQFPLDTHSQAGMAALAALAAQKQEKFWPMHDALFAQKGNLSPQNVMAIAGRIGLSLIRFEADLRSPDLKRIVERDLQDGERAGVRGTPTVFVNGQRYNGAVKLEALKPIIDAQLKSPASSATASLRAH